ncbi:MAG: hypothetical protein FJ399_03380 [Verrucomicrobia bacterium]|nr:hypothetical protein [Verrucomicrobiota bacterium]
MRRTARRSCASSSPSASTRRRCISPRSPPQAEDSRWRAWRRARRAERWAGAPAPAVGGTPVRCGRSGGGRSPRPVRRTSAASAAATSAAGWPRF